MKLDFTKVVGHEQIIKLLKKSIVTQTVSHAYLYAGEDGIGKNRMANVFAQALQCKNPIIEETGQEDVKVCGVCKSCLQMKSSNHPDVIHVTHDKASIGVDDIRLQVNNQMNIKPYSSPYKIFIIDEAEKMTEQAQNALLKTIEEPPSYAIILLLTNNVSLMLQTIVSRCVLLHFKSVAEDRIKDYLMEEYQIPDYKAELSTIFSQGNVGKAVEYASSETFTELKNEVLHILKYLDDMKLHEIIDGLKHISEKKDNIFEYLDFMILWYRDVLLYKVTMDPNLLIYREEQREVARQASLKSYEGIEKIIAAIEKAKVRLNANVNFDITMELMLFTIKES